jgi:heat shock protein HtpX
MSKRIILFLLTNLLVGGALYAITSALGLQGYLGYRNSTYTGLIIGSVLYGFAGALISLALSRVMAKWMMGVQLVTPQSPSPYGQVASEVYELARRANLPAMPEVGVYESDEMNAFATGPSQRRSLVAVSTGLLAQMPPDEVRAVLAHEIAHIKNGDMVTQTLLQGVINSFAIFLARILANVASSFVDEKIGFLVYWIVNIVLQIVFTILGSLVTMWFSRHREFKADAYAAELVGARPMAGALTTLKERYVSLDAPNGLQTAKINGNRGFLALFSTHPPLEDRINALLKIR